jgi:hypothetical protein
MNRPRILAREEQSEVDESKARVGIQTGRRSRFFSSGIRVGMAGLVGLFALAGAAAALGPGRPLREANVAGSGDARTSSSTPSTDRPLPTRLSETGLYLTGTTVVAPENLPFAPQYPLWSDGATKRRWVSIPKGATIDGSQPDARVFPVGTRFWKEFSFGERAETRMIERLSDGSFRYSTYVWDAKLGDAVLAPDDGQRSAVALRGGAHHDIPSRDDCRACHEGRPTRVLGFNALQLSSDRDPKAPHREPLPPDAVDLEALVRRGLLVNFPEAALAHPPHISASSDDARAAAGYLFGNCAHCHTTTGPLAALGLDFDQSVLDPNGGARLERSTVGRTSRYRLPGADASERVAQGRPERSTLAFRMRRRDRVSQMPPLGTQLVDDEAVGLVEHWIAGTAGHQRAL